MNIVYLDKNLNLFQGGGNKASLGRVYVEDPDDWDQHDKTFKWKNKPNKLFELDSNTGTIYATSQVREGR